MIFVVLVTAAFSARQLLQAGPGETTAFPGCTFLRDSEIATNPDFSILYYNLQYTGLNNTLSSLSSVVTLFAPTNEAFLQYQAAVNETGAQAMTEPPRAGEAATFLADSFELHVANKSLMVIALCTLCMDGGFTIVSQCIEGMHGHMGICQTTGCTL